MIETLGDLIESGSGAGMEESNQKGVNNGTSNNAADA